MKKIALLLIVFCLLSLMVSCTEAVEVVSDKPDADSLQATDVEKTDEPVVDTDTEKTDEPVVDTDVEKTDEPIVDTDTEKTDEPSEDTPETKPDAPAYKQATDSDKNVVVGTDGIVSITIPEWFLLKTEPDYDYRLTDEEANTYKFISVTKNADGSATYKIGYNDYHGFMLISKSSVNAVVYKYKHNVWFTNIESDAGFNNINIYTKYDALEDFDDEFAVYVALSGLQTTFYQYMNYNYSVKTTISVYNKDNVLLATYKFPDLLK